MQTVKIWQGSEEGNYNCIHTLKDHTAEVSNCVDILLQNNFTFFAILCFWILELQIAGQLVFFLHAYSHISFLWLLNFCYSKIENIYEISIYQAFVTNMIITHFGMLSYDTQNSSHTANAVLSSNFLYHLYSGPFMFHSYKTCENAPPLSLKALFTVTKHVNMPHHCP